MTSREARPDRLLQSRQKALTAGLYLAENHFHDGFRLEVLLGTGQELPNCPHCGAEMEWEYLGRYGRTVIDAEELVKRKKLSEDIFVT